MLNNKLEGDYESPSRLNNTPQHMGTAKAMADLFQTSKEGQGSPKNQVAKEQLISTQQVHKGAS